MVSCTHEQNSICSPKKLNDIAHEQTIICRQLFAGHVVGSRPMKRKKHLHRMINIYVFLEVERFSYDLEMKTREQNRNNKRTEIERFDWCIEQIQTHLAFGWLSERSGKQTSCPKNFLEIALTSYCNTIGQSNNAFSILGFSLAGKRRVHVLFFPSIG